MSFLDGQADGRSRKPPRKTLALYNHIESNTKVTSLAGVAKTEVNETVFDLPIYLGSVCRNAQKV